MRLSEISWAPGITVQRDGDFQTLGFISDVCQNLLVFVEDARFLGSLDQHRTVSAVLTTSELAGCIPAGLAVATSAEPRAAFARLHNELARRGFYWEDFPTVIDPTATVHPTAWVAERNVRIGAATDVQPNATVLERCVIGEGVVVGAGAV